MTCVSFRYIVQLRRTLLPLLVCIAVFGSWLPVHAEPLLEYAITPVPTWVEELPAFAERSSAGEASRGFLYRVRDMQVNAIAASSLTFYQSFEYQLVSRYAVENYSQFSIDFDPTYEQLHLHSITLQRADQIINKLPTARLHVVQREQDLDGLIYDGTKTLSAILDDVRVGDTIRYAYSIQGENPIFSGLREFRAFTEFSSTVDRQHLRVLSNADRPLHVARFNSDLPFQTNTRQGVTELTFNQQHIPAYESEADVPSWRGDRGVIVFSDVSQWQQIVDWALPMYQMDAETNSELTTIAQNIQAEHTDKEARIGAALHWVQDHIRYFGVEIGVNSHQPSSPAETLSRRFGDCKDKTVLLISLLQLLDVPAAPALVNTTGAPAADDYPMKLHAFDHVIVHVTINGASHWLDPTDGYQRGKLGEFSEPDYGKALVIAEGQHQLRNMDPQGILHSMTIRKNLYVPDVDDEFARLSVHSVKTGLLAERSRYLLETDGVRELSGSYESYYRKYFPGIRIAEEMDVTDGLDNRVVITEQYDLNSFWESDNNVDQYHWLYSDEIRSYLKSPDDALVRTRSYELTHPVEIVETWELEWTDTLRLDDLDGGEVNEFFALHKTSNLNELDRTLTVTTTYKSLSNEVPAASMKEFSDAIERAGDVVAFYIERVEPGTVDESSKIETVWASTPSSLLMSAIGGVFMLLLFFFVRKAWA